MKFVAQFDVTSNQNWEKGVPVTNIFDSNATLAEIEEWVRSNTGAGQYQYHRCSDIRISIIKED